MAIDLDAIMRDEESKEEEDREDSAPEGPDNLFFMEPDHKEVRTNEDPDTQDYWEAGLTMETQSALKTGNVDHSQKSCYHCSCKGHIKENCSERRKLGAQPWTKRPGPRVQRTAVRRGYGSQVKTHPRGRGTTEPRQREGEYSNSWKRIFSKG